MKVTVHTKIKMQSCIRRHINGKSCDVSGVSQLNSVAAFVATEEAGDSKCKKKPTKKNIKKLRTAHDRMF